MPNIQGDYSLTEIATKLNVSASWINDVQRKTGICLKKSTQGKRAEFTKHDEFMLKQVKTLRTLDFSLDDIKHIYALEQRYIKLAFGKPIEIEPKDGKDFVAILQGYLLEDPHPNSINSMKLSKEGKTQHDKLLDEYLSISLEVCRRMDKLALSLEEQKKRLKHNANLGSRVI